MNKEPIRILQVFGRLNRGGAEGVIMNLYRNIDRTKIQFDFVVHTDQKCAYDDEIIEMGGRIYSVPQFKGTNIISYCRKWNSFFKEQKEYKIIHSHVSSTAVLYLLMAKHRGLTTIIHSHNISSGKGIQAVVKDILQYPLRFMSDYYMACSLEAGKWLFGKRIIRSNRFHLLYNAISLTDYNYNKNNRDLSRKELNISENKKVIINVGRFHYQKNHEFLIDLFAKLVQDNEDYLLLLVGDGELKTEIMNQVEMFKIHENVCFLGVREDIADLLCASDLFLFPSHFEGLPLALIEAQASGLPCLISDAIPNEVVVTNIVHQLSLSDSIKLWKKKVEQILCTQSERKSVITDELSFYDIRITSKWLSEFYIDLYHEGI